MVKWSIEISEYILEFRSREFIKAKALADLVIKCTFYNSLSQDQYQQLAIGSSSYQVTLEEESDLWLVYVDGSSV